MFKSPPHNRCVGHGEGFCRLWSNAWIQRAAASATGGRSMSAPTALRERQRVPRLRREASPDASCRRAAAASLPKAMTGAMRALLPTDTGSQKSGIRNECNLPEANPVDDRPRRIALRAIVCSAKRTSSACPCKSNFCGSGVSAYLAYFRLLPRIGKNKLQNMESHS